MEAQEASPSPLEGAPRASQPPSQALPKQHPRLPPTAGTTAVGTRGE